MEKVVKTRGLARVLIISGLLSISPSLALAGSPMATILSPADGEVETKGRSVHFEGSGSDAEDGILKGKSLVWTSDREGQVGTGGSFGTKLSSGSHLITLTVTDSDGDTDTAQVSITIVE